MFEYKKFAKAYNLIKRKGYATTIR